MKQLADKFTVDLFEKRGRGRPRKIDAKSSAQRQADFRQRQKLLPVIFVTRNEKSSS